MNTNISNLLFASRKITFIAGPSNPLAVGQQGPSGVGYSAHRPSNANNRAKISKLLVAIEKIFNGMINGFICSDYGIYVEYTSEGEKYAVYSNIDKLRYIGKEDTSLSNILAIIFLTVLTAPKDNNIVVSSPTAHTKEIYDTYLNLVNSYENNGICEMEDLLRICDSFYYYLKDVPEFVIDDTLAAEEIQQAIRNNQFMPSPLFDGLDFEKVDFEYNENPFDNELPSNESEKWKAIKNGDMQIAYEWGEEQQRYIPDPKILDNFVPTETFYSLFGKVNYELNEVIARMDIGKTGVQAIGDNYVNAIMLGKPGTGKTTIAEALGAALGIPVRTIVTSKNTEEDTYEGKNKIVDGSFKFCETSFLDVYQNGGIAVIEEFNLADPAVIMGALGQALVPPFTLMKDGYIEVKRHPMCIIIATMNTGTQGSREPNEAFTSRLPKVYLLDDPVEEDFIRILSSKGNDVSDCKKVYHLYNDIVNYLNDNSYEQEAMSLTMRQCLEALKDIKCGVPLKRAIKETIVNSLAIKDVALAKEVYEAVVEPSPIC